MYMVCLVHMCSVAYFFFFKQKTAYEMRISDWSSDVCSSDLLGFAFLVLIMPAGRQLAQIGAKIGRQLRMLEAEFDVRTQIAELGPAVVPHAFEFIGEHGDRKSVV